MTKYFNRYITDKIISGFKRNQIIILIGSRQAGKTYISKNYLENHTGGKTKGLYYNFENSVDLEAWQTIEYLEKHLAQSNLTLKDKIFFVIDEFHYLKNATKILKLIYDIYPNIKILATGSSSIEIQKHLKESLAGRKIVYIVYPLSFEEYLQAIYKDELWNKLDDENALPSQINSLNKNHLENYLLFGGYPRIADNYNNSGEAKKEELNEIYNSYIQKDIKALIGGENILSYNNLVKVLAAQIGNLLNINEISETLRMSRYDIEKYLNILEQTYIIKRMPAYFKNKRKEITKMPKIYFYDLGLVNMISANFGDLQARSNLGAIMENYCFNQLQYFISISDSVFFWRTLDGAEVDFVWQRDDGIIPMEIKWSSFKEPIIPASLKSFCGKFSGVKEAWVITKDYTGSKIVEDIKFYFIPAVLLIKKIKSLQNS